MAEDGAKFFQLDEGTEDFYKFPDDFWDEDEDEAAAVEIDVDLRKVVLVDVSAFHRNILKAQAEAAGFKIAGVVGSAAEARPALTDGKVRFAAVDIDQTDGGGTKSIQMIAATNPGTVFILTSSRMTQAQAAQVGLGGFYFIAKPFQKENVKAVLDRAYDTELHKKKAAAPKPNPGAPS